MCYLICASLLIAAPLAGVASSTTAELCALRLKSSGEMFQFQGRYATLEVGEMHSLLRGDVLLTVLCGIQLKMVATSAGIKAQ